MGETTVVNVKKFPSSIYRDFKSVCAKEGWSILEGTIKAFTALIEKKRGR
ncbi:hypothetical protein KAR91_86490 [Candidatus Pacearchaeota archaeon]|nr:hypothetical protein [Candidatus Pacearchaeota archaeon]